MSILPKLHSLPTRSDIERVHQAIAPFIHRTPVFRSRLTDARIGASLFFKCENLQRIGAFKMRGAMSALLSLTSEEQQRGVATHSSGNHAQALALAASLQGIPAYIVMPSNAPAAKRAATEGYGATIIECSPTLASRESTLAEVVARTGATFVPPYNDYHIIAGQATAAKELLEEIPDLDVVIAPVGGGGLMSGTALWTRYAAPQALALGAEPLEVNDAFRSLQAGQLVENTTTNTIADGLRTNLGDKTFSVIRDYVPEILCVEEDAIREAMRWLWTRLKLVVEPSGAVPFAAIAAQATRFAGKRIGLILSGGNVDFER